VATDDIREAIKQAIAKVSKIEEASIDDHADFREDLGLDSLSILETLVELQCRFKIPDVPDEEFAGIRTIEDAVQFVQEWLPLEVA
jgi:acyl carrier protein